MRGEIQDDQKARGAAASPEPASSLDVAAFNDRLARDHDINDYYTKAPLPIRWIEQTRLRIIREMVAGLEQYMDEKGFKTINDFIGKSVPTLTHWEDLDINYHHVANINQDKCIHCGLCYIACEDASHQSISLTYGKPYNTYAIKEEECVGCNLCQLICPVADCITMVEQRKGDEYLNWKEFQLQGLPLNDH